MFEVDVKKNMMEKKGREAGDQLGFGALIYPLQLLQ